MKTLLHIIDTTGPGGAETVFIDLISHLPESDFRSIVVIRGEGWVCDELKRRGIHPVILEAKGSFNWRYLKQLVALIRREKVDLIQSHLLGSNIYSAMAGFLSRRPVVATFHGAVDVSEGERLLALKFAVINLGVSAIVAVSDSLRSNIIQRTGLRAKKTQVIYNGIDTAYFKRPKKNDLRERFSWGEEDVIIASLGNIRPAKAYDVLLHAAALVKESNKNFRFVVAGDYKGALYLRLQKLSAKLQLENHVCFLGFTDDPAEFLSNADLFVLSSSSEGFSIATIQAMAAGLPVVVTRSGGPQEIVTDEKNGCLVDTGNPQQLADVIMRLADDAVLKKKLALAGCQHARDSFDIKSMVGSYHKIYEKLLSK